MEQKIQQFKGHLINEEKADATAEKYIRDVTAFFKWLDGWDISKAEVQEYKNTRQIGSNAFSRRIFCGDCGSAFGSKVWHSNDKYHIMNLESKKNELKKLELNKWENYLQFVKNPNNYKGASHTISIGSTESLAPAEYAHLFEYLPEYEKLKKFVIPGIENEKTVFGKALTIMHWLTQNTYYSGAQMESLPDDSLKILNFSFRKGFEYAINCRHKAIVLTDFLIAHDIMAYPILLEDKNHWGSHFVVHAFCSDDSKWVVLDPSFNCYFQNKSGLTLNIYELRELRLKNENLLVIDYSFNGTNECIDIYLQYFVGVTLTYITTWESNSNDKRNSFYNRKKFQSNLPMGVPTTKKISSLNIGITSPQNNLFTT